MLSGVTTSVGFFELFMKLLFDSRAALDGLAGGVDSDLVLDGLNNGNFPCSPFVLDGITLCLHELMMLEVANAAIASS
jgi:hypothetical protein